MKELSQTDENILTDYAKEKFSETLKKIKKSDSEIKFKEISFLKFAYKEDTNDFIIQCHSILNVDYLIYDSKKDLFSESSFITDLEYDVIYVFNICNIKINKTQESMINYTFNFKSIDDAILKLKTSKLDIGFKANDVCQKAVKFITKELRLKKINYMLNN